MKHKKNEIIARGEALSIVKSRISSNKPHMIKYLDLLYIKGIPKRIAFSMLKEDPEVQEYMQGIDEYDELDSYFSENEDYLLLSQHYERQAQTNNELANIQLKLEAEMELPKLKKLAEKYDKMIDNAIMNEEEITEKRYVRKLKRVEAEIKVCRASIQKKPHKSEGKSMNILINNSQNTMNNGPLKSTTIGSSGGLHDSNGKAFLSPEEKVRREREVLENMIEYDEDKK